MSRRLDKFLASLSECELEKLCRVIGVAELEAERMGRLSKPEFDAECLRHAEQAERDGNRELAKQFREHTRPITGTFYERELWRWEHDPDAAAQLTQMGFTKEELLTSAKRNDAYVQGWRQKMASRA